MQSVFRTGTADPSPIGRRVHVIGNSTSGKSTLAERLARARCGFRGVGRAQLAARLGGPQRDRSGGTGAAVPACHPRRCVGGGRLLFRVRPAGVLVSVGHRDLAGSALWLLLKRFFLRSWRRWRRRELLWGTNFERLWPQFALWRGNDSLLYWILTQHARKRRVTLAWMADPRWAHIRFVRLTSASEVETFARAVEASVPH